VSGDAPVRGKEWRLTESAFNRLLERLDEDRDRAAEKYETVRRKLTSFFHWRGCANPEEYVDEVFDRVARRTEEGAPWQTENPYVYFHGVALNVLREHWRAPQTQSLEDLPGASQPSVDPAVQQRRREDSEATDRRLACMQRCIQQLPVESRQLVVQYHGPEGVKIDTRKRLAGALGIPLNALRTRVCRIRAALETCVGACLGGPAE